MMATQARVAVKLLSEQIQFAHMVLEGTIEGVTAEVATTKPAGLARSIGSNYAHIVIGEDLVISGTLRGQAPLFASEWRGRTGFDSLPPPDPAEWPGWSSQAQSDGVSSRAYAQAVYAATAAYLETLTDADLARTLDLSAIGLGEQTVAWVLSTFVVTNCNWHTGEISCIKGGHGLKGYPF